MSKLEHKMLHCSTAKWRKVEQVAQTILLHHHPYGGRGGVERSKGNKLEWSKLMGNQVADGDFLERYPDSGLRDDGRISETF
jgi:hypothetical protein